MLEAAIARGIEQLHATVEFTMARFLAHANAGVQGQTCVKLILTLQQWQQSLP